MTEKQILSTYDFDEDAMGLGDFVAAQIEALPNDQIVVLVHDDQSNPATSARFERETLTDGSKVVNLIISFDRA